ncbi:hypothetical protein F4677DRAFT_328479 [Hypoxylon crocopeplum]|nr:hypothetical protein F4677DRAFT_328479 [Hypoxylon crocopeplum]
MYRSKISRLVFAVRLLVSYVHGQQSGWLENQVNATMCWWHNLRVATLKDTVYLDGGHLSWVAGMADGSQSLPREDDNPLGLIYTFNFSTPFNANTNFSTVFNTTSKAPNGGAANNIAPNYYDGTLLANSDEFYLYGGLLILTSAYSPPDADEVFEYMASQYGPGRDNFHPSFINNKLPDGMTRYVTYGGGVNAPSENKAWYFGGYRSESWGPIYEYSGNTSYDPSRVSSTLITLDMATQQQEVWENVTLPAGTPSRANPSVVWVPVGEQGILVVIGGVTYPEFMDSNRTSENDAQSMRDSPGFMNNIDIYDIANKRWYQQSTISGPPQLTMGCAVVATASDYSSFNIYYYGGYNGLDQNSDFNDDVWILSLPSFMWMKVSSGTAEHARAGHQCVMPYPDQMITIGGRTSTKGDNLLCLDGDPPGLLQVYNLTANRWMDSYDPNSWDHYGVPDMIHVMIGGDYSGGATVTTPTPSGWATPALASVFATPYNTSKLTAYYPYSSVGPANGTREDYQQGGGGGGTPSWVGAVLGVVLGLVFVTAVVVGILLYRRRKFLKKGGGSENSTDESGNRILSWVRAQTSDGKAPTVTTDETRTQYDEMESRGVTPMRSPGYTEMRMAPLTEMPDTPLVELMDTSPRVELVGDTGSSHTGLTHIADLKNSPFASNPHTPHSISTPTIYTGNGSHDHPSSISSSNSPQPPSYAQRPDSPPLGNTNPMASINAYVADTHTTTPPSRNGVASGVSGISDRDKAHLRQISDATVSSATGSQGPAAAAAAPEAPTPAPAPAPQDPFSPISPPLPVSPPSVFSVEGHEASDYISQQGRGQGPNIGSPLRRSMFHENGDDLGEHDEQRR